MNWFTGILVYVIIWWLVFFMSLPIGVRPPHEEGKMAEEGHDRGAPTRPRLGIKVLASSIIGGLLWGLVYWVIEGDIITLRGT
ncbi:MAG: putative secreted protein [Alphaproteobacteria bacterium]|jgi:predicted secreted protein